MPLSGRMFVEDYTSRLALYGQEIDRQIEAASLVATDQAGQAMAAAVKSQMAAAGLGRLARPINSGSDMRRNATVHRHAGGFSASGSVYVGTRSERTRGAIEAYTAGATIRPTRGRWLWIATDAIPARAGKQKMTPALYAAAGLDRKLGPLVFLRSVNGLPLLVIKTATTAADGSSRRARGRTKTGKIRKGQVAREFIVAFIAIPSTTRAARVDVDGIARSVTANLPALFDAAIGSR